MSKIEKIKVVVAMSGGVDSSVAAALLKGAGFALPQGQGNPERSRRVDVVGVFMKFWHDTRIDTDKKTDKHRKHRLENRCCSVEAQEDARRVAAKLGIPLYTLNLEKEFKKAVVDYFLREYRAGRTPNPCVVCNKEIKFGLLLKKAMGMKADFVATGHYARLRREFPISNFQFPIKSKISNSKIQRPIKLLQAKDKNKDQSYFLWNLTQKQLSRILFPIGDYTKNKVRKIAKKWGLPVAEKPESQEICFIPEGGLNNFLRCHIKTKKGPIVTVGGNLIGEHRGLAFYTIGQRKGIGVAGKEPYFVVDKDAEGNTLIVASLSQKKALLKKELIAKNVNWISGKEPNWPLKVKAKIRYRHEPTSAVITLEPKNQKTKKPKNKKTYKLIFGEPQRAITPAQSVVFYKGKELLGGGIIN